MQKDKVMCIISERVPTLSDTQATKTLSIHNVDFQLKLAMRETTAAWVQHRVMRISDQWKVKFMFFLYVIMINTA